MSHNPTPAEVKAKLSRIEDDLLEVAGLLPEEQDAEELRLASYRINSVRLAIGELIQVAAHANGQVGPVASHILRERKLAA